MLADASRQIVAKKSRRSAVADCCVIYWRNNTKYHGDIVGDVALQQLPEVDIPEQLKMVIRTTDDEKIVDEENDGYVPVEREVCAGVDSDNVHFIIIITLSEMSVWWMVDKSFHLI